MPFEYVLTKVKPVRDVSADARMKKHWWLHGRSRPAFRKAIVGAKRYIATPEVSKHRIFVWVDSKIVPDHKLHVFPREDDYFFGILCSSLHDVWSLTLGSTLEDRPSYNSETTFDTFPFPWPPNKEPQDDPRVQAIAAAAKNLVELRDRWLNPPDTPDDELKKRTLTNLYNARPQWLDDAHRTLDRAVFAAYGWPDDLTDQGILERLLALNHQRAAAQQSPETGKRKKSNSREFTESAPVDEQSNIL